MARTIALLATSGLVPIVVMSAVFGTATLQGERRAIEEEAHAHAAFSAALISNRLLDEERQVEMVAQSSSLSPELNPSKFRELATRLLAIQPTWRTLSVAAADGERLLDVPLPIGGREHGAVVDPTSLKAVVALRRADIGQVLPGPGGRLAFAIRAPVIHAGRTPYVVSAVVPSGSLADLLRFKDLPQGWNAILVDGAGTIVASTNPRALAVGRVASASALHARAIGAAAPYGFTRVDGTKAQGVFSRVEGTRWSVHVSAPAWVFAAPIRRALLLVAASTLACLLLFWAVARMLVSELRQNRVKEAAAGQTQRMEALGQLTGGVAHDLNNLLTPIIGGLELLRRRSTDERSVRYIDLAYGSAERAKTLVGRLLAFSRRQPLQPQDVDVSRLLLGLSELLKGSLTPKVVLKMDAVQAAGTVRADPAQLELAVLNLAVNARDAMPDGGTLSIGCRRASVREARSLGPGDYVSITVSDTGSGMDEATLRQAIEPFFTTKAADQGTGLGLSMIHGFAAQSGGALHLESEPGRGTLAVITLPAGRPDAAANDDRADLRLQKGLRVLLVDDDEAVRVTTTEMLAALGHEVRAVATVDQALSALGSPGRFDAVITDYLMPGRSGGDLIARIEADWPGVGILVATGYLRASDEVPDHVALLRKPFNSAELNEALGRTVDGHRARILS